MKKDTILVMMVSVCMVLATMPVHAANDDPVTPPPCFLAGTKIAMADGSYKNIKQVKVGDLVKSYDNGTIVTGEVTDVYAHTPDEMSGSYMIINGKLRVTPNHVLYVNGGWEPAGNVTVGDELLNQYNETVLVTSVAWVEEYVPTYNLEIETYHTFFADDILVHNQKNPMDPPQPPVIINGSNNPPDTPSAPSGLTLVKTPPACFLAGTKISMADGSKKNIQQVEVGDMVKSYDHGEIVSGEVIEVFEHAQEEIDHYLKINDKLRVTPNHFIRVNGKWMPVCQAGLGDKLLDENGGEIIIDSVEEVWEQAPTYNLEISKYHTFFADGMLVHNAKAGYTYNSSTTDPDGDKISYLFDWGDGSDSGWRGPYTSGTTAFATHLWTSPGTYYVKVKAKDEHGNESGWSESLKVTVNAPPTADFTYSPSSPTTEDTIHFTDLSTDTDGDIEDWYWEFGDGSTSTSQNPGHTYTSAGTYTVTLTVTDDKNASSSVSKSITIKEVIEIKVAILQGVLFTTAADQIKGILINDGDWITDTHHYTFSVDIVTAGDVCGEFGGILRTDSTNNYDLFIIPGIAEPYLFCAPNFDVTNWRSNIQSFVNNGGGYLGICGGAVAASSGLTGGDGITTPMERLIESSTLDLIRAKAIQDFAHPMTATLAGYPSAVGQTAYLVYNLSGDAYRTIPTGVSIDLQSIDTSHVFFNGFQEPQVAIRWYGGPGFVSEGADILAYYPTQEVSANANTRFHVWEYDGPRTAPVEITTNYLNPTDDDLNEYVDWLKNNMDFPHVVDYDMISEEYINTHVSNSGAIVADTYGNGRAIVFGPHPEDWTWTGSYIQDNNDTDNNNCMKGLYHWEEDFTKNDAPEWMIIRGAAWAIGLPDSELPPIP